MSRTLRFSTYWIGLLLMGLASSLRAADAPATQPSQDYMRFVGDPQGGGKLQTASVTYQNSDGVQVDLIGAVHVGEKAYYDELNKQFEGYDAMLYEMVL